MSLERRIADALHAADDYEPSLDLFSRLQRSIEEDRAHRRRIHITLGLVGVGAMLLAGFFASVARLSSDGTVTLPKWSIQVAVALILTTVLVSLGPVLRRLGSPLLDEVFHLSAATGQRFSRLLDIAYYLFFGGLIINSVDPRGLVERVDVSGEQVWTGVARIAGFLLQLGIAHTLNLALLPLIGLLFTSLTRRARRRAAGGGAPPQSPGAQRADRFAGIVVMTVSVLVIAGALILVGAVLVSLALS